MLKKRVVLECGCCESGEPCTCDGRCNPLEIDLDTSSEVPTDDCENPLPVTLSVDIAATPSDGSDTCFTGSGTITFETPLTPAPPDGRAIAPFCWGGRISGSCTDCNGTARTWYVDVYLCCTDSTLNEYTISVEPGLPATIGEEEASVTVSATSCDPFLVEGCIPGELVGFIVACMGTMPPSPGTTYSICITIYETP